MGWEIRAAAVDDIAELVRVDWAAFGAHVTDARIEKVHVFLERDRSLVAVEGDRIVGTASTLTFEFTVPGLALVPAAGVTYVGVLPTHRRRGILTALLDELLHDADRRDEPLSVLTASESGIYRRFGYGVGVLNTSVEIERQHARLRRPVDVHGRVRLVDGESMVDVLPPIFDRYRRQQPGEIGRPPSYWSGRWRELGSPRGGAGTRFAALWDGDGNHGCAAGYVTYRIAENGEGGGSAGQTLAIEDLVAVDRQARRGLWQYCLDIDAVGTISAWNVALDEPLWWMLADRRRLRVTRVKDFLWVRLLDVERALSARTYGRDGSLVIEVADAFRPHAGGRFRLDVEGGVATCRRTDKLADLALDAAELGAVYLGGVRFATLERADVVAELTPGALVRADGMFATALAPTSCSPF